ncbi:MAG: hypothetical protein AB9919_06980 [Geobacteraceae bacterium]
MEELLKEILAELKLLNSKVGRVDSDAKQRADEAHALINNIMAKLPGMGGMNNGQ